MEKTLKDFKREVAEENGHENWQHILNRNEGEQYFEVVAERYASHLHRKGWEEGARAQRVVCEENAMLDCGFELGIRKEVEFMDDMRNDIGVTVDQKSILSSPLAEYPKE